MPYPAPTSSEELARMGYTPGVSVQYAKNPTVTLGVLNGTWVSGTLVRIYKHKGRGALFGDITLSDGQSVSVDMSAVRLAG